MYNKNICSNEEYIQGRNTEQLLKPIIEKLLNCNLTAKSRYSKYDFISECKKILIEIKGRKISSDKYNSTYVNIEKILNIATNKDIYFFFKFTNGIKYIKYNSKLFSTFKIKTTYLKHRNCLVKNLLIPTDLLIDVKV